MAERGYNSVCTVHIWFSHISDSRLTRRLWFLSHYKLVDNNESSLRYYRSVEWVRRPYYASVIESGPHHKRWDLAPDGNIKAFEELAQALAEEHSVDLRSVSLDALSESPISAAIDTTMKALEGWVDTLVHNAGQMAYGPG
jgi:hypothetical protein